MHPAQHVTTTDNLPLPPPTLVTSAIAPGPIDTRIVSHAAARALRAAERYDDRGRHSSFLKALWVELGWATFLMVVLVTIMLGLFAASVGPVGVFALAVGVLPVVPLFAAGLWLDRYEPEPPWLLARALLWGAGTSVFMAGIINDAGGAALGEAVSTVLVAPFVEEALKATGIYLIYRRFSHHFHGVKDGIVFAVFVGIGFSVVEDAMYYVEAFRTQGSGALLSTIAIRSLPMAFMHAFFTMFTGMAIGRAAQLPRAWTRVGLIACGYLMAVSLHALWNSGLGFVLYPVIYAPAFFFALWRLRTHRRHQRELIERWIQPEITTGLMSPHAYDRLLAPTRLREYAGSLRRSSHALHRTRRVQAASWELATYRGHVAECARRGVVVGPYDRALDDRLRRSLADTLREDAPPPPALAYPHAA